MSPEVVSRGLILVVDDDDIIRSMMRAELEEDGFTVLEAADGEAACAVCDEHQPDLLVVDVVMPRMDGFELCRVLRSQHATAYVPILMATGLDDVDSIVTAYEAGATDFISKPLTWIILTHRIRYMLRAGRAFAELRENQAHLLAAMNAAEQANRAKTEFLANMSHELRTPLNSIIGFADLIRTAEFGPIAARYLDYADNIGESGAHLLAIINDILDLSRAEANQLTLAEDDVDIARVVQVTLGVVGEMARKGELDCPVEIEPGLPAFHGDALKLRQILINLLGNAIKFTPPGGRVALAVGRDAEGGLYFRVTDTGIGIPADKIPIALSPFGQVDTGLARQFGGAGLGLPLTKRLIELHGGRLEITSEVEKGTTVLAVFPPDRFLLDGDRGRSAERAAL